MTGEIRRAIEARAPELVDALFAMALAGDSTAARALLDRICPTLKPQAQAVPLPGLSTAGPQAVLEALEAGTIDATQAAALLATLSDGAKAMRRAEFDAKTEALDGMFDRVLNLKTSPAPMPEPRQDLLGWD